MVVNGIQSPRAWLLIACAGMAVALGRALPSLFGAGMPQVPGEDVVALVFGDMRQELSAAMMDKAEEYYHGGVRDAACEEGLAEESHGHEHEEHAPEHAATGPGGVADAWSWINRHIHTQEDRHLEHERAVELLPWLWAACRASPKNVQAFAQGSYVLSRMAGKPEEGARLLEEGIRNNPACAELDFSLGELLFNALHDAPRAEHWFRSAHQKCHPAEGPAGEEARLLKVRTLFYLGYLAKQKGEVDRLSTYVKEAEALAPEQKCTRDLRAFLTNQK